MREKEELRGPSYVLRSSREKKHTLQTFRLMRAPQGNWPELTVAELVIFFPLRANSFRAAGNEMVFTLSITPAVYLTNSAAETGIFKTKRI